jgi:hypothetical protein
MGQANCRHRHRHASDQVIELHSSPTSHRDHDPLEQLERADFAPLPRHLLYRRDGVDPSAKTARKPEWAPPGAPTPSGAPYEDRMSHELSRRRLKPRAPLADKT